MAVIRVKHVNTVRGADGRTRHYHRLTKERLPDEPEARARRVLEIDGRDVAAIMVQSGLARAYDGGRRETWCR